MMQEAWYQHSVFHGSAHLCLTTPCLWLQVTVYLGTIPPRSYLHQEGMQPVALAIWHVQLSKHHRMRCCLAHVAHPKLGSLKIRGVYDELL